jgi:hypothetical protein
VNPIIEAVRSSHGNNIRAKGALSRSLLKTHTLSLSLALAVSISVGEGLLLMCLVYHTYLSKKPSQKQETSKGVCFLFHEPVREDAALLEKR